MRWSRIGGGGEGQFLFVVLELGGGRWGKAAEAVGCKVEVREQGVSSALRYRMKTIVHAAATDLRAHGLLLLPESTIESLAQCRIQLHVPFPASELQETARGKKGFEVEESGKVSE